MLLEPLESRIAPATFLVTNLNDAGAGSLRAAIDSANAADGTDSITVKTKLEGVITLKSDLAAITDDLSLVGNGKVTISGAGKHQIFDVEGSGLAISLDHLTITRGLAADGGGLLVNDAGGTVTLTSVKLLDNAAARAGGGIAVQAGTLQMVKGKVSGNSAEGLGGGIYNGAAGTLSLTQTKVLNNAAHAATDFSSQGGGIFNAGAAELSGVTINGNFATAGRGGDAAGGGVFNATGATLTLQDSTVSGNHVLAGKGTAGTDGENGAKGQNAASDTYAGYYGQPGSDGSDGTKGGDAVGGGIANYGTLTLKSTLISGNSVLAGKGGAGGSGGDGGNGGKGGDGYFYADYLYVAGLGGDGGAGGNGGAGGEAGSAQGGGVFNFQGTITVRNSTISGNSVLEGDAGAGGAAGKGGAIGASGTNPTGGGGGSDPVYYYAESLRSATITKSKVTGHGTKAATEGDPSYDPVPGAKGEAGEDGAAGVSMGGGIFSAEGTVNLSQVMIGKNSAKTSGGGVALEDSAVASIANSTIAGNSAKTGGGLSISGISLGSVDVISTIIAGNKAPTNADVNGTINATTSLVQVLGTANLTNTGNLVGLDPKLKISTKHGADPNLFLISKKSVAVDAGTNPNDLQTDLRGGIRVAGGGIDIGAVEVG